MPMPISSYVPQCAPTDARSRRSLVAWLIVTGGTLALLALVLLAPITVARGHSFLSHVMYGIFRAVCHQMPERSFHIGGHALAVCARCSGIYAGVAVGALLYPLMRPLKSRHTPTRAWLFAAAVPTTIDFVLGVFGVWENTHFSRAMTGALLGAVAAFFIVPGVVDLAYTDWRSLFRTRHAVSE